MNPSDPLSLPPAACASTVIRLPADIGQAGRSLDQFGALQLGGQRLEHLGDAVEHGRAFGEAGLRRTLEASVFEDGGTVGRSPLRQLEAIQLLTMLREPKTS